MVKVIETKRLMEKTAKTTACNLLLNISYFIASSFFHMSGMPMVP